MASPILSVYRVYANTVSSLEYLPNANINKEIHIVVPFARDYDSSNIYTTGNFVPYFDTTNFTAATIKSIKNNAKYTPLKFFLSIGGRDSRFPFAVTSADDPTWTKAATDSLKKLAGDYGFDGIDVYYEHINPNAEAQFASSIFEVVSNLKREGVITLASITVSNRLDNRYYDLFTKEEKRFDYVVYQTHKESNAISNVKDLDAVFDVLRYPKGKILAGHSDIPGDWATVTPPIFLGAVPQLFTKGIYGFSKWIVTPNDHNPEA